MEMHAYNIFEDIESTVHGIMQNARWKIVPGLHSPATIYVLKEIDEEIDCARVDM